jgi:hypothetical protein
MEQTEISGSKISISQSRRIIQPQEILQPDAIAELIDTEDSPTPSADCAKATGYLHSAAMAVTDSGLIIPVTTPNKTTLLPADTTLPANQAKSKGDSAQ